MSALQRSFLPGATGNTVTFPLGFVDGIDNPFEIIDDGWTVSTMSKFGENLLDPHRISMFEICPTLTILVLKSKYINSEIYQFHAWWWPGFLRRQAISCEGIDYE